MAREPTAVEQRVNLELGGAQHQLDPLARFRVGDVVAAALEAEEPVTRHNPGRAVDHQIRGRRQPQQRRVIALRADGDDLAVGAVLALAGDLLVPRQPRNVRLLIAGETVAAQQPLADIGDV